MTVLNILSNENLTWVVKGKRRVFPPKNDQDVKRHEAKLFNNININHYDLLIY